MADLTPRMVEVLDMLSRETHHWTDIHAATDRALELRGMIKYEGNYDEWVTLTPLGREALAKWKEEHE